MSSHNDRLRGRTGFFPSGLKFPPFQGLCLDSSAYLSNAMGGPVMVLSSTCGDVTPHAQSHVTFAARQQPGRLDGNKESSNVSTNNFTSPTFPVRPLFGQGDPYSSLSSPLLSLQHPLFTSHALGRSYLNAAGAFRPLGLMDDRNGAFHGSAFMPAKCMKLDGISSGSDLGGPQPLLLGSCFQGSGSESNFHQSPANSTGSSLGQGVGSFMDGKDDRGDSDSMADGPDRMSETPNLSEESRSIERSTPEDSGTPKRHKKYFLDGQTPYCPVCGVSLQLSELSSHFDLEVERLMEMNKCPSSHIEISSMHSPFSSPLCMVRKDDKGKPESRWETYQRVKGNRTTRLTSARCVIKRKKWDDPNERAQEESVHLLPPALRKREQDMDPETSIDSRTAANFNWAVTARLHAYASLQRSLPDFSARKFEVPEDENQELNVDGDDSATYGQPHYTEADVITCSTEDNTDNKEQIRRLQSNESSYQRLSESNQWTMNGGNNGEGQEVTSTCVNTNDTSECISPSDKNSKPNKEVNGDNPKDQIEDGIKCLICMEPFIKPVVSICCWHVHCEECWLKTLGTKKLCPQCNMITAARDLRRIYL
ncbi:e3 ubiquitin-protein ligase Rnf220 [Nephila pilipes]|uniref:E3 ubiquitin-protein ligase Rnf220 n=1 Tax=Nephila pilipes TaxID=299642 RepID=A0A8X6TGX2_NEPPI|nr:e3 ubiquitin-protein ligase Rnf220 [Nephila pilipes]